MEGPFLSTAATASPAKRSLAVSDDMDNGGSSKRRPKPPPPPIVVPPGHSAFRLLCHVSKIGGVIGKSGSIIKVLRQETGAKIRVEESVASCDERIILVVAPENPKKKILIGREDPAREELLASAAQEALVRVFDRIMEVEADMESTDTGGPISCRLLAATTQVGAVMGKGGKNIEKIRKESGSMIRVLPLEQLPACAAPADELIQITGDVLAIKKALVAISSCLQDNSQSVKAQVVNNPHVTLPNRHGELLSRSFLHPSVPGKYGVYVATGPPASIGVNRIYTPDRKIQQEISFRLLCSNDTIGGVIGKGGAIVRALQNESGSSISVSASVAELEERVITVSASENPGSRFSQAQNALVRVFNRSVEAVMERGVEPVSHVTARLLVPTNQIGCLMGKGGVIIQEIRNVSGASIRIIGSGLVPKCASEHEEVVQITGELGNVLDALFHVTSRLRDSIFSTNLLKIPGAGVFSSTLPEITPHGNVEPTRGRYPSMGLSPSLGFQRNLARSMDHFGMSGINRHSPPRLLSSQKFGAIADTGTGLTSRRGGFTSGNKAAIVTNTTVDIVVPASVFGLVYGKNGSNLSRIKQNSGATVIVHDPLPGTNDGMVIISGTPDQTQEAQSLLHASILGG